MSDIKADEHIQGTESLMSPMTSNCIEMGGSITALIEGVVQTNLRATQELLRLENPEALVELQQRFVRDYMAALMQGAMTFVNAIKSGMPG
jgi:hypothetical protein